MQTMIEMTSPLKPVASRPVNAENARKPAEMKNPARPQMMAPHAIQFSSFVKPCAGWLLRGDFRQSRRNQVRCGWE